MAHDEEGSTVGEKEQDQRQKNEKNTTKQAMLWQMLKLTLLKHARTLGTPSLGPSMPGMKSILGPIQLKGLTMVNSRPFSAPSAVNNNNKKKKIRKIYETNAC